MPGTLILSDRETGGKKKKNRNKFPRRSVWAWSLVLQVMRNKSEPLRTSSLKRKEARCMFQNTKGRPTLYLLLHSLSFHFNQYLPTRAIHSALASTGRTSNQSFAFLHSSTEMQVLCLDQNHKQEVFLVARIVHSSLLSVSSGSFKGFSYSPL